MQEKYFHGDDVIDDVTGRPQSRSSIFFYDGKNNIFRDNCRTNKISSLKLVYICVTELNIRLYKLS